MILLIASVLVSVIIVFIQRRRREIYCYTPAFIFLFGLAILSTICLAQNYTNSLLTQLNDGIGISNGLAYAIIGERMWTISLFKTYFNVSVYFSCALLILLVLSFILESRKLKRSRS